MDGQLVQIQVPQVLEEGDGTQNLCGAGANTLCSLASNPTVSTEHKAVLPLAVVSSWISLQL